MDDKPHSVSDGVYTWTVLQLSIEIEPPEDGESYLDLRLESDSRSLELRFWGPRDLKIDGLSPRSRTQISVFDVSHRGLDNIKVHATPGASHGIEFWARSVEEI